VGQLPLGLLQEMILKEPHSMFKGTQYKKKEIKTSKQRVGDKEPLEIVGGQQKL